jgi:hypothetical protein
MELSGCIDFKFPGIANPLRVPGKIAISKIITELGF